MTKAPIPGWMRYPDDEPPDDELCETCGRVADRDVCPACGDEDRETDDGPR